MQLIHFMDAAMKTGDLEWLFTMTQLCMEGSSLPLGAMISPLSHECLRSQVFHPKLKLDLGKITSPKVQKYYALWKKHQSA